jgi:hypothetical protein
MQETTWCGYVRRAHRDGHLTRHWRDVLLELHSYRGAGGIAWPAHATLAERAECCVRTVQRALEAARDLGLVSWTARRLRAGWRSLRSSNAYRLERPQTPLELVPGRRRPYVRLARQGSVRAVLSALGGSPRTAGLFVRGDEKEEQRRAQEQGIFGFRLAPHPPVRTAAEQIALLLGTFGANAEAAGLGREQAEGGSIPAPETGGAAAE